jgi:hypothetical protein
LIGNSATNEDWTGQTRPGGEKYDHFTIADDARQLIADDVEAIIKERRRYRYGRKE